MSLLDEFLYSLQKTTQDDLMYEIERAREDCKNSYLLDEVSDINSTKNTNSVRVETYSTPVYAGSVGKKDNYRCSYTRSIDTEKREKEEASIDESKTYSMRTFQRGTEAA